ncbi:MAG: HK97 gp10 family phage protein [Proteobacteria bacterium]|nr:HK97 gp10 family phage protein [Pseudomonadota bacterium]
MGEFFSVKMSGNLDAALEQFAARAKDLAAVGAQAMAQAVYDDAKATTAFKDKTGKLRAAIYQVHSRDKSVHGRHEYHVSWNRNKAPHGHLVEFGTSRAPAHPFLYPAFDQNKGRLVDVANTAMAAKLKEVA